jgi:hypothetical protein
VACFAPAQNFYSERLTITHVPTRSTSSNKPSGRCQRVFPRRPEPIGCTVEALRCPA